MGKRAAEETEEEVAAAALAAKKAAKKAKKAAAAAAAAVEEAEVEEEDPAAAKKAAKKAKKAAAAAAAAAEAEEEEEEPVVTKKKKKAKKAAAEEEEEEAEDVPVKKVEAAPEPMEGGDPTAKGKGKKGGKDGGNENTVFVRGLPFATTEEALNKDFGECGEIVSCRMPLNDEGSCRGIAFIKFTEKEGMDKALAYNETDYGGRTIYCTPAADKPEGKGKGKEGGKGGGDENTVFVRGLPFATTEEALNKDFGECGEIVSCRMPLNDEGSCRGIAFIKFTEKEGMDKALAYNETDYGGRTIFCTPAADKPDGKGKGKDGKGKDKGKKGKGKKGKAPSASFAKSTGAMVESTGKKQTFDSDDDE